jgi:hypothetical protein
MHFECLSCNWLWCIFFTWWFCLTQWAGCYLSPILQKPTLRGQEMEPLSKFTERGSSEGHCHSSSCALNHYVVRVWPEFVWETCKVLSSRTWGHAGGFALARQDRGGSELNIPIWEWKGQREMEGAWEDLAWPAGSSHCYHFSLPIWSVRTSPFLPTNTM